MRDATRAFSSKQLLVIVIVVVLAVFVAGYFVMRRLMKSPTQPSLVEGRAVAEAFLDSVRSGKAGEAWDAATAEFKSIEGRESFIRKARSTPTLKEPLQFNSSQQVMIQEQPRTEFLYQSSKSTMVRILVGYERGSWKVDRLTL